MTTGVATLYGRFDTARPRRGVGQQRAEVDLERVTLGDVDHRIVADDRLQHGHEVTVELQGADLHAGLAQRERQRSDARTDLEDVVTRFEAGEPDDPPRGVCRRRGSSARARGSGARRARAAGR